MHPSILESDIWVYGPSIAVLNTKFDTRGMKQNLRIFKDKNLYINKAKHLKLNHNYT